MQNHNPYHFLALLAFMGNSKDREELLEPLIPVMLQRTRTPAIKESEIGAESEIRKSLSSFVI